MKEIELRADEPFFTHVDVAVIDFPDGCREKGRQRCKVTVEFAESDVRQLQKRGLDFEEVMAYYRDWIYRIVKFHLAQDWICTGGLEQVMKIVEDRVKTYF